jgi:hypothetical protein
MSKSLIGQFKSYYTIMDNDESEAILAILGHNLLVITDFQSKNCTKTGKIILLPYQD